MNRLALETARERLRGAADIEDKSERNKAANWALQSEAHYRISSALKLAAVMNPIATTRKMFDTDSMLLGCANGIVDLKTGQLKPGQPEEMISMSTGVNFDPHAKAPRWEQFLNEIFSEDQNV